MSTSGAGAPKYTVYDVWGQEMLLNTGWLDGSSSSSSWTEKIEIWSETVVRFRDEQNGMMYISFKDEEGRLYTPYLDHADATEGI